MDKRIISMILTNALFKGTNQLTLQGVLAERLRIVSYEKGDLICGEPNYVKGLGIIIDGKATVTKKSTEDVVLRILKEGDIFGVATIFSNQVTYVSKISAMEDCNIAFLSEELIEELFKLDFTLVKNYITFLTNKIYFLNGKIDGFTANSAEERLEMFLKNNAKATPSGEYEIIIDSSFSKLSKMLNVSRASLYRIIANLENKNVIKKDGKRIVIMKIDSE